MPKLLSIVVPSFRDERILDAIASVRLFDDLSTVQLIVIDGGSPPELVDRIAATLTSEDVLVCEPDRGIFDALNKGLDRVETPYVGWIGSDDLYAKGAKSSKVVDALSRYDLYVMDLMVVREGRVRRRTHSWPSSTGLVRWGLHNPHYSTFGRSALLRKFRFSTDILGSDIEYFLSVFGECPRVINDSTVGMLMAEGGFSSAGYGKIARINRQLFGAYRAHGGTGTAVVALALKLGYKLGGLLRHKLLPETTESYFPTPLNVTAGHPARPAGM